MSDLLNSASLVLIPSGYKEDVVYSAVPTDGSGDLSFTRASNGTRINSAGLVEVVAWNLLQQSETFQNAAWTANSNTVTANTTTAPNGTTTADTFTLVAGADASIYQAVNGESNNYTTSVYAKYVSGDKYLYFFSQLNSQGAKVWFDIQNGTVSNQVSGFTGTIENAGNGWYKCSMYNTTASDSTYIQFGISTTNSSRTLSNNSVAYFWGAQVNLGTLKPYFPTTDRLNVPRLTYQNGGGGCPSLLLEKQSTNSFIYSEQFDNASWIGDRRTITANNATSPDGTQNADLFTATATLGSHNINPATLISFLSSAGTFSVFAKYNGYNLSLSIAGSGANWTGCVFDLQNGIARTPQSSGAQSACTAKIEDFGNGWYRCSISYTSYTTGTFYTFIGATSTNNATLGSYGLEDFTANGTSGFYLYGAQLETASSYPTSYIPTTSASATRVADACSKTGISSLIGQTEGTIFVDVQDLAQETFLFSFNESTSSSVSILKNSSNQIQCQVWGSVLVTIFSSAVSNIRLKIAFAYKSGSVAVYINGVQAGTSATTFTLGTTMDTIYLPYRGTYYAISQTALYNQVGLFKTRLTNAELASLTTL
jgi:hypothetical protein